MNNKQLILEAGTHGANVDITTNQVIETIESLEKDFRITITVISAQEDNCTCEVESLPEDKWALAELLGEIYDFSPDSYIHGFGGLIAHMRHERRFVLWWD